LPKSKHYDCPRCRILFGKLVMCIRKRTDCERDESGSLICRTRTYRCPDCDFAFKATSSIDGYIDMVDGLKKQKEQILSA